MLDFRFVERSVTVPGPGKNPWRFPDRSDYLRYVIDCGELSKDGDIFERPDLVEAIQRHWHSLGQNGCRFAQFLTDVRLEHGWATAVVAKSAGGSWDKESVKTIDEVVRAGVRDPDTASMSILFPDVITTSELCGLLRQLGDMTGWIQEAEGPIDVGNRRRLAKVTLRFRLNEAVEAYVLGFGPFACLARTRQAPFTEVVMRLKPRRPPVRKGLKDEPGTAHLADMYDRMSMEDAAWDMLLNGTVWNRRTMVVTGGSDDETAKAKVTFAVPWEEWEATGE